MPLENPTYISDLVTSNPAGTDERRFGDDHIRNLKTALKNTFPNANAAIVFPTFHGSILTTNTTIAAGDNGKTFLVDSSPTSITLSLPAVGGLFAGWNIRIKNITPAGGNGSRFVVIDPNASELIEGGSTFRIYPTEDVTVVCIGANFRVLGMGSRVLLGSLTASNNSVLDFIELGPNAPRFRSFEFEIDALAATTTPVDLHVRSSDDNGVNYSTSGYPHVRVGGGVGGGTPTVTGSNSDSTVVFFTGAVNSNACHGLMRFTSIAPRSVLWKVGAVGGGNNYATVDGYGRLTTNPNAIRFFYTPGNIASGTIRCYGMV